MIERMGTSAITKPNVESSSRLAQGARRLSLALGTYAVAGGILSLAGWVLDIPRLTDWQATGISIQPNTCVAVTLAGLALLAFGLGRRRTMLLATLGFGTIGLVTLLEYTFHAGSAFDTLLAFGRTWGLGATSPTGRMGLPATISLGMLATAMLLAVRGPLERRVASTLAIFVLSIAGLSFVGYAFGAQHLYSLPPITAIAWQTSTFLAAVSLGLVLALRDQPPTRLLIEDSAAGALARRSLPFVVVVPLIVAWLRWNGQRSGVFTLETGVAILALTSILLNILILAWGVAAVSRHERTVREGNERLDRARREAARAERLMAALGEQTALWRAESDPEALGLIEAIAEGVSREFGVSRCGWSRVDQETGIITVEADHHGSRTSLCGAYQIDQAGAHVIEDGKLGRITVVEDLAADPRTAGIYAAAYAPRDVRSQVAVPLHREGQWVAIFWLTHHEPRTWTSAEVDLLRMAADRIWLVVERSRAELALRLANRRKDVFLATLAHELRNPLAPIASSLEVVSLSSGESGPARQAVDIMSRQLRHMVRLIEDLMDVSRISRDKLELRLQETELVSVVRAAANAALPALETAGHRLELDLPVEPIRLAGDRVRLHQVVDNLLTNAGKYTDSGGVIRVAVRREDGHATITVRDNGIGLPADRLHSIFEMFSQVDGSLERTRGGMGIGLSLVKRLVELHGGSVSASSDGPGHGSLFTVRLPVAEAAPAAESSSVAAPAGFLRGRRVLVADDNRDGAHTLAMLLRLDGGEVVICHDGLEAAEQAAAWRPEIVLLDLGMPRMNGYDACQRIRSGPGGDGMVVVAISGWGQEEDRRRSREAGFDGHMVKPVDQALLIRLLAGIVEGRASARAHEQPVQ
jgi:signal transduction histidine kinase/CheY-like chemotaxis protein